MENNNLSQSSDNSINNAEDKRKENKIQLILNDTLDNEFLLRKIEHSKYPIVKVNRFNVNEYNLRHSSFRITKHVQTIIDNVFIATHYSKFVNKKIDIQYLGSRKGYGVIAIDNIAQNEIVSMYYGTIYEKSPRWKNSRVIDIVDGGREYWLVTKKDDESYAAFYNDNHLNPNLEIRYLQPTFADYKFPYFVTSRKILKDEELTFRYFGNNEDYWWRNVGSKYQSLKYDLRKPKALCGSKSLQKIFEYHVDKGISEDKSSFEIVDCNEKGKGVIAKRKFPKDSFLMFYNGQEVDEKELVDDAYVYEIHIANKRKWVNAFHSKCYSRYMNDNNENPNVYVKPMKHPTNSKIYIVFLAKRDIEPGDQLEYDYGGGSRNYDWRKKPKLNRDISMGANPEETLSECNDYVNVLKTSFDSKKENGLKKGNGTTEENENEENESLVLNEDFTSKVHKQTENNINDVEEIEKNITESNNEVSEKDENVTNIIEVEEKGNINEVDVMEYDDVVLMDYDVSLNDDFALKKLDILDISSDLSKKSNRDILHQVVYNFKETLLGLYNLRKSNELGNEYSPNIKEAIDISASLKESSTYLSIWNDGRTLYEYYLRMQIAFNEPTSSNRINWLPASNEGNVVINDNLYNCLDSLETLIIGKGDCKVITFSYEQKIEKLFEFICKSIKLPVTSGQEPLVLVEEQAKLCQESSNLIQETVDHIQEPNNYFQNLKNTDKESTSLIQETTNNDLPTNSVRELLNIVREPTNSVLEPVNEGNEPTNLVQKSINTDNEPTNLIREITNISSDCDPALSIIDLTSDFPRRKFFENREKMVGHLPKEQPFRVRAETRPLQLLSNANYNSNNNRNNTSNSSSNHNANHSSTNKNLRLKNIQQFNKCFEEIESWLLEMERELEVESCGTDLSDVQNQLNKLAHFDAAMLSYQDRMDGFKLSCQHLKESTINELNIRAKQKILEERYSALLNKTLTRKTSLRSSLKAFRLLREIEEEESWIQEKEPLTQITSWGRDLTGVKTLISKHEEVINEIKRHENKLIALKSSALQKHFTSNKNIHSKLFKLNKNWELLLWSCSRRMNQLYYSQKFHQFFASAFELETWLDEREKAPSLARSSEDKDEFGMLLKAMNCQAEEIYLASKGKDLEAVSVCQGFVLTPIKENLENLEGSAEITSQKDIAIVKAKLNAIKDRYNKLMKIRSS